MNQQKPKKCLLMVLCMLLTLPALGQIKKGKLEIGGDSDYEGPASGLKQFGRSAFHASIRMEKFLNDNNYQYIQQDLIKKGSGIELSYSFIVVYPLALEIAGFYSTFGVEPIADGREKSVKHMGFEFYADMFVLPYIGKISNYVAPYVGLGYQTSSLKWGDKISAGTGGPIFKVGTKIRLTKGACVLFEYKQTFPKSSNKLFRSLNLGVGYNF